MQRSRKFGSWREIERAFVFEEMNSVEKEKIVGAAPAGAADRESAARAVREMFTSIAPRYDLLNHVLSLNIDRLWWWRTARRFDAILQRPGARVLDLCCGTGDMAFALRRRAVAARDVRILGADFSHAMLQRAAEKGNGVKAAAQVPQPSGSTGARGPVRANPLRRPRLLRISCGLLRDLLRLRRVDILGEDVADRACDGCEICRVVDAAANVSQDGVVDQHPDCGRLVAVPCFHQQPGPVVVGGRHAQAARFALSRFSMDAVRPSSVESRSFTCTLRMSR